MTIIKNMDRTSGDEDVGKMELSLNPAGNVNGVAVLWEKV